MTAAAVIRVARREIGTVESPTGSNRQKYGEAYGWNGVAWCAQFCWWVFREAGVAPLIPKTAGTELLRKWYRDRNQWTMDPQPGDLVLFKFSKSLSRTVDHVGIVEAVEPGGTLITIEGNTVGGKTGDQRNGGGVHRRRRGRFNVVGFARPDYAPEPPTPPKPAPSASARPVLRRGSSGSAVELLHRFLGVVPPGGLGYGAFGPATETAVRRYQQMRGLAPDGVVGPATWREMGL